MKYFILISEPILNWSENEKQIHSIFDKEARYLDQKTCSIKQQDNQGIVNRKVQTLRQTTLQMRTREGAWTKVLSLCKLPWRLSKNDIYSTKRQRSCSRLYQKFFGCSKSFRRNQRDQFRTTSALNNIEDSNEINSLQPIHGSYFDCEYVARFFEIGAK